MRHCVNQLSRHRLKREGFNQRACAHGRLGIGHKPNPLLEKQLTWGRLARWSLFKTVHFRSWPYTWLPRVIKEQKSIYKILSFVSTHTYTMSHYLINLVLKEFFIGRGLSCRTSLWLAGCSRVIYDDKFLTGVSLSPAGEDWWDTRERSIISGRRRRIGIWEICSQSHLQAGGHVRNPHLHIHRMPSFPHLCVRTGNQCKPVKVNTLFVCSLQALMGTTHSKRVDARGNWQMLVIVSVCCHLHRHLLKTVPPMPILAQVHTVLESWSK